MKNFIYPEKEEPLQNPNFHEHKQINVKGQDRIRIGLIHIEKVLIFPNSPFLLVT